MRDTDLARELIPVLTTALTAHGFVPAPGPLPDKASGANVIAALVWKTWNTNRAVVVVVDPGGAAMGNLARWVRDDIARPLGYLPFFYGVGLQVVVVGRDLGPRVGDLDASVDKVDNQWAIVQSIHAVDLTARRRTSARTWGQIVTGKFQDAIEAAIDGWLGPPIGAGDAPDTSNPFSPPKT